MTYSNNRVTNHKDGAIAYSDGKLLTGPIRAASSKSRHSGVRVGDTHILVPS